MKGKVFQAGGTPGDSSEAEGSLGCSKNWQKAGVGAAEGGKGSVGKDELREASTGHTMQGRRMC